MLFHILTIPKVMFILISKSVILMSAVLVERLYPLFHTAKEVRFSSNPEPPIEVKSPFSL